MATRSLQSLLTGLIDYAGLFPPARLSMQAAVEEYARARMGSHGWMLSRFICPASRLDEFERAASPLFPGTFATSGYREHAHAGEPWEVSVLIDSPGVEGLRKDLSRIAAFNTKHAAEDAGQASIDVVELRAPAPSFIDQAIEIIPDEIYPFFEFPITQDCRGFVAALAGNAAGAKVRTGGLTPDLIPPTRALAEFIRACAAVDIPFKATAGLHHPVRSEYPLDSAPDAPRALMHGFFNVFIGACLFKERQIDDTTLRAVLDERVAANFRFADTGVHWRDESLDTTELAHLREAFALSFGSCSLDEPIGDLIKFELLEP